MFTVILRSQWKAARPALLLIALALVLYPYLLLHAPGYRDGQYDMPSLIQRAMTFGVSLQMVALITGVLLAVGTWQPDHVTKHIYALSLPVSRSRYLLMRMGAGLALHVPVVLVFVVASAVAVTQAPLPETMQAFPVGLGVRWLVAAWTVYSLIFLVMSLSKRAGQFVLAAIVTVVFVDVALSGSGVTDSPWLLDQLSGLLQSSFGPVGSFMYQWMLVDV